MRLTSLCTPSLIVYCLYRPTDSSRCTRGCHVFYHLKLAVFLLFFFVFFLIDLFTDSKFSDVEFLSLTSETQLAHCFLLKDKHPSKIVPYPFARSAYKNGYSCWPLKQFLSTIETLYRVSSYGMLRYTPDDDTLNCSRF